MGISWRWQWGVLRFSLNGDAYVKAFAVSSRVRPLSGASHRQHLVSDHGVLLSFLLDGRPSDHSFGRPNACVLGVCVCVTKPSHIPKAQRLSLIGPLVMDTTCSPNSGTVVLDRFPATCSYGVRPSFPTWYLVWRHTGCRANHVRSGARRAPFCRADVPTQFVLS